MARSFSPLGVIDCVRALLRHALNASGRPVNQIGEVSIDGCVRGVACSSGDPPNQFTRREFRQSLRPNWTQQHKWSLS